MNAVTDYIVYEKGKNFNEVNGKEFRTIDACLARYVDD